MAFLGTLLIFLSFSGSVVAAAPLTPVEEEKMVGKWLVNGGDVSRLYEITAGRNLRIEGSGRKDRHGRLSPQPDGTYVVKLDGPFLRISYVPASDALTVECFAGMKDIERGLQPMWKAAAVRKDK